MAYSVCQWVVVVGGHNAIHAGGFSIDTSIAQHHRDSGSGSSEMVVF